MLLLLLFYGITGVWTSSFALLGLCSTAWNTTLALSAPVILEIGTLFLPGPTCSVVLLFYDSLPSWENRHVSPVLAFFCSDEVSWWSHDLPDFNLPLSYSGRCMLPYPAYWLRCGPANFLPWLVSIQSSWSLYPK
jgi:hypothetical protein